MKETLFHPCPHSSLATVCEGFFFLGLLVFELLVDLICYSITQTFLRYQTDVGNVQGAISCAP